MKGTTLPVGIQADIDEAFCYREDSSYQERSHEYLERYEVPRGYRDTAVQAVVTDLARRAFQAGAEGRTEAEAVGDLGEIQAELLETAAKCTRAAMAIGGVSSMTRLYVSGPVTGRHDGNRKAFAVAGVALADAGYTWFDPHDLVNPYDTHETAMLVCINELTSHYESGRGIELHYDGLALLPGWEQSEGARLERAVAEACGIPVKTVEEWIEEAR